MADATPQKAPFNPTWASVALVILTGVISGSVSTALNSRDAADFREFRAAQEQWNATMERRMSANELDTGKTLVALSKDVERMGSAIASIQQALMVRPSPAAYASPNP